jgi:uncharacterized protein (DUF2267 family)
MGEFAWATAWRLATVLAEAKGVAGAGMAPLTLRLTGYSRPRTITRCEMEARMTQPYDVEFASQQYQSWLAALKERASLVTHNQSQAMMRAVMHELRRSLDTRSILAIANALPVLPRGIFIDGWSADDVPEPVASAEAFLARVTKALESHHTPPETIVEDVFAVWSENLGKREREEIGGALPEALRPLWPG